MAHFIIEISSTTKDLALKLAHGKLDETISFSSKSLNDLQ